MSISIFSTSVPVVEHPLLERRSSVAGRAPGRSADFDPAALPMRRGIDRTATRLAAVRMRTPSISASTRVSPGRNIHVDFSIIHSLGVCVQRQGLGSGALAGTAPMCGGDYIVCAKRIPGAFWRALEHIHNSPHLPARLAPTIQKSARTDEAVTRPRSLRRCRRHAHRATALCAPAHDR